MDNAAATFQTRCSDTHAMPSSRSWSDQKRQTCTTSSSAVRVDASKGSPPSEHDPVQTLRQEEAAAGSVLAHLGNKSAPC
eukprot:6013599-Amphidinium_carterae.1